LIKIPIVNTIYIINRLYTRLLEAKRKQLVFVPILGDYRILEECKLLLESDNQ